MISHIAVLLPQPSTLMYMERLEEREAVIRSFTVPQIQSAISHSLMLSYSLKHTNTHTSVYRISSPTPPHSSPLHPPSFSIPIRAHLAITSSAPPPQRNQFRLLLHTVMACWPREMESFQVLGYNLPPCLPPHPSLPPLAAPQHFLNTPGVSAG